MKLEIDKLSCLLLSCISLSLFLIHWFQAFSSSPIKFRPCVKSSFQLRTTSRDNQQLLDHSCSQIFLRAHSKCISFASHTFSDAGFGHQIAELIFSAEKARSLAIPYAFSSFSASSAHSGMYNHLSTNLGIRAFFETFGLTSTSFQKNCSTAITTSGYFFCSNPNCFFSPELRGSFQLYSTCFQSVFQSFGSVNNSCILPHNSSDSSILFIVWHVRLGDVTLHAHTDEVFFINVISALLQIAENDFLKWHVFIVGGGGQSRYENLVSFRNAIQLHFNRITATKKIIVDTKILSWNLQESFFAMMQAHIVVGSGSSFVHAAHLFSNFPIFLNHEPKHGFNHGLEMMTDSVDMNRNGQILDSLRRIRITFRNKFFGLSQRGPPCRVPT